MADIRTLMSFEDIGLVSFDDIVKTLKDHGGMSVHATMVDENDVPLAVMAVVRGKAASALVIKALEEAQDLDDPEGDPGQEG